MDLSKTRDRGDVGEYWTEGPLLLCEDRDEGAGAGLEH